MAAVPQIQFTSTNLKMWARVNCTKANGTKRQAREKVLGFSFGLMGRNMKAYGLRDRLMEEEG